MSTDPAAAAAAVSSSTASAAADGMPNAALRAPTPAVAPAHRATRGGPLPLRPRGGFGGYLHELRRERGLTVRHLAAAAGVHHTYVSKLERGDRQAPEPAIVEALAAALQATPAQLDQLRWRAGHSPQGTGAPGQNDATLTLVAEALAHPALPAAERDRLRHHIAQLTRTALDPVSPPAVGVTTPTPAPYPAAPASTWPAYPGPNESTPVPPSTSFPGPAGMLPGYTPVHAAPEPAPDPRAALLAGLLGGWQTVDEAAAELRVAPAYVWSLVQSGHLRAWALPGAIGVPGAPPSPAGVRLRREDVLALLRPLRV